MNKYLTMSGQNVDQTTSQNTKGLGTKKQKVLFVLPTLTSGGAERVLITLMNGIDRTLYDPIFLAVHHKGELKYLIDDTIPYHSMSKKLSPLSLPALYFKLRDIKPDIIVSTMAHMNFALLGLKPFFPKTKFIVREAITPSFLFQKYEPWDFLIKLLYKCLYPLANAIISPSQKIFDEFTNSLSMKEKNFALIPNPVDIEKTRADTNLPFITDKRKTTVNFVACGRLGKQKGFDRLIEYLARADMPHDWKLDILGEGDERHNLVIQIKSHNLQDKISMPGLLKAPYKHFAQADCFLLPSRFEGLPNVVLETLSCGTPVIATAESGGIDEIAAAAPNEAITIVETMDAFIEKMKKITPAPKEKFAPSLLPDIYKKETILKKFNALLSSVNA